MLIHYLERHIDVETIIILLGFESTVWKIKYLSYLENLHLGNHEFWLASKSRYQNKSFFLSLPLSPKADDIYGACILFCILVSNYLQFSDSYKLKFFDHHIVIDVDPYINWELITSPLEVELIPFELRNSWMWKELKGSLGCWKTRVKSSVESKSI